MNRIQRSLVVVLIIFAGLFIRFGGHALQFPPFIVKYGGSTLWGLMVYVLVTIAKPGKPFSAGIIAFIIAVLVEFSRLVHIDWLDEFRTTLAGAILLGRYFSYYDILAYGIAIVVGVLADRRFFNRI